MNKNKYLEEKIEVLDLDSNIISNLKKVNIAFVKDLWTQNRKKLKSMNLSDSDINKIIIKLQLIGLDLNKKDYK